MNKDLNDRLFNFAVLGGEIKSEDNTSKRLNILIKNKRIIENTISPPKLLKFLPKLPQTPEFKIIRYQLAKSSTSSGANYSPYQI
jgi:acyl-coenzyme A synthetase/AMP-(fatty) acid ligase